jgi:hypothetical protein
MTAPLTDSSGQSYQEFYVTPNTRVRVTRVPYAEWAKGPTIRIQRRDANGRTVFGPELPIDRALDLISAISDLVREGKP